MELQLGQVLGWPGVSPLLPPGDYRPLTHLLLPGAPDARHRLMEPVDGFPVWAEGEGA